MEICRPNPEWSSLPEDIVLNILARLPLIHFQRVRTVCTAWNRLATDPSFNRARASPHSSLPGFALFLSNESTSQLFYLDLNDASKWRCISLSFLPNSGASLKLLASSGGLLLLGTHTGDLLVTNPITKQWKELPPTEAIRDPFYTALMADNSLGNFAVAVAESELRSAAATEIYESKTGRWRSGVKPARAGRWKRVASAMSTPWFYGSVSVYCKPVYCGGAFYHLTWDPEEMVSELDLGEGAWRCKKGNGAVPGGTRWGVMEQGGKVVLLEMSYDTKVGGGRGAGAWNYGGDATLSLWELRRDCLQWAFRTSVPQPPNSEYRIDKWRRFAIGEGFICTTFLLSGSIVTFASQQSDPQPGMIYDCGRATWIPMPDLPGTPWGSISSLFSYTASLHPL